MVRTARARRLPVTPFHMIMGAGRVDVFGGKQMLRGMARPHLVELLYANRRVKVLDFPSGRAKTYGECMAVARDAIRASLTKADGVMRHKHIGDEFQYDHVRILAGNGRPICSWSTGDEQRHG